MKLQNLLFLAFLLLPLNSNATTISQFNPVSHYTFDSVYTDSNTINVNDLTAFNSPTFVTGLRNDAVDLESTSNQYLSSNDASSLDFTNEFTISFWFKPESLATTKNDQRLFFKGNLGSEGNGGYRAGYNSPGGTNKILVQIWDSAGTDEQWQTTNAVLASTTVWTHVVIAVKASTSDCKIYINGSSVAVSNVGDTATAIGANTGKYYISALNGGGSGYIDGILDEYTIFNTQLSSSTVSLIYNSGVPLPYATTASPTRVPVVISEQDMLSNVICTNGSTSTSCTYSYTSPVSGFFQEGILFALGFLLLFIGVYTYKLLIHRKT